MVKDTGRRDSAGLEDMDAFFSPAVEKSPKKGRLSPAGKPNYRTKLQAAMQSDDSVPMSGTSSNPLSSSHLMIGSIRNPVEVLASRKSLLAQRIYTLELN
jgi:Kinetochore CENP-C fungal homologue, Mif2, N-terminal